MRFAVTLAMAVGALGLFAGSAAADSPKSYSLRLTTAAAIGAHEFTPGDYKVLMHSHDAKVVISDNKGNDVELEAKVQAVDRKFEYTSTRVATVDGVRRILEIRFAGSKAALLFE